MYQITKYIYKLNIIVSLANKQNNRSMLLHILSHTFGSTGWIFKIQLLAYSELLRAANCCNHSTKFAKRKK